jgi:short-subunit dehydrogenase
VVAKFAFSFLNYTRRHFLPGMSTLRRPNDFLESRYGTGSWVLVVGATGRLGCAFGHEFAQRNFSIVLMDDNPEKLEMHAQNYKKRYPMIMVKVILVNFEAAATPGWTEHIMKELGSMAISVLINAVQGAMTMTTSQDGNNAPTAKSTEEEFIRKSLVVNIFPTILMTETILGRLAERFRKVKIRGAIITIAQPIEAEVGKERKIAWSPTVVLYQSVKALTSTFSRTKMVQYSGGSGVDCLSVYPGRIACSDDENSGHLTAQQCATASINQLRYGVQVTTGWWWHDLRSMLFNLFLPDKWLYRYLEWKSSRTQNIVRYGDVTL